MIFDYNYAQRPFGLRAHNVRPYTKLCVMVDFANGAPSRRALQSVCTSGGGQGVGIEADPAADSVRANG